ncbi:hypothetical protein [Streptomyces sp. NPDC004267]|uniref:hypothetical protein n=1 Tax=Streptomyces sp. NPDC004267 TaxID=3364694 RepID=UPI0036C17CF4
MTTDLGALTTAADKWESMAGEIKKVEDRYKDTVQKISMGQDWLGVSADFAQTNFAGTRYEYAAAQTQAKAIASLLRDAHTQFVALKKNLDSTKADAVQAGMTVSDQGIVTFDWARLSEADRSAYRHDPDGQKTVSEAVGKWQKHLDDRVKAVSDADEGVKIALDAVVVDGFRTGKGDDTFLNGFNADAKGDIEVYEAEHAKDIATRINSGEKVSAADYAELDRAFRDNSGNKEFSQTFVGGLGPDGMIKFSQRLNHSALDSDKKNKDRYTTLETGLANTLATATQVPGKVTDAPPGSKAFKQWLDSPDGRFYRDFTDGLQKAGVKSDDSETGNPLYGYQSFVSLMDHANTPYDDQFLYDLGDDLIDAEKQHPLIFTKWGRGHGGVETDAIDGLLGVMSKNPDAATAFFDAKGNGTPGDTVTNDHLHYLTGSGHGTRDWPRNTILGIQPTTMDDPSSRIGLGAALEAATTGHAPLGPNQDPWPVVPHTEAQARVMHDLIGGLGPDQKMHQNLREPLSRALASYTEDTHAILGGMSDSRYVTSATGDGFFQKDGNTHMAVTQKDLVQFMRGLSDDPEAYANLHKAESRYISLEMEKIPNGATGFSQSNPLHNAGAALGALSSIREDVLNDDRMSKYAKADWESKIAYHVIGGAVTPLYFTTAGGISIAFGDSLQRGVDTWAWQFGNGLKAQADATANAAIADHYLNASNQMQLMVDSWADGRNDVNADARAGLKDAILDGHDRGANQAQKYLTDTSN